MCIPEQDVPFCLVWDVPSFFGQLLEELVSAKHIGEHPFALLALNGTVIDAALYGLGKLLFCVLGVRRLNVLKHNLT